jgi:hypothetical protein
MVGMAQPRTSREKTLLAPNTDILPFPVDRPITAGILRALDRLTRSQGATPAASNVSASALGSANPTNSVYQHQSTD